MQQAFLFLGGLFEISLDAFVRSSRLRGLTVLNLRTRGEVRQSAPLKVRMVTALEECVVEDGGHGSALALVAGASLFTLFSRTRVGDVARCTVEPKLDIAPGGKHGYVETRFDLHKTARPGARDLLPVTASAFGITREPWAACWLKARAVAGLSAERQGTLLPVAAESGWHDVAMKTTEFAAQLRSLLIQLGFSIDELERVGAHSLKSTCLAWASKFGVPKEQRRLLGYHLAPGDRTLEAYSRDSMACPLRSLDEVFAAIASKGFDPDATRSGVFVTPASRGSSAAALPASGDGALTPTMSKADETADAESSSASSSLSSASPVASSDEGEEQADEIMKDIVIQNTSTKKFHLDAGEGRLRDGKPYPRKFIRMRAVPPGGRLCTRCF